jgi:hypothetical protein
LENKIASNEMNPRDAERQELQRAIEILGRTTRSGRLLEYLGAKYLEQQEQQLTEFIIATEVFGRSDKKFDPTTDAVVRVETHRLRKKLREIYERDSRSAGLQISLPAGTYVPKFAALSEAPPGGTDSTAAPGETEIPGERRTARLVPVWGWALAVAAAVIAGVAGVVMKGGSPQNPTAASSSPTAQPAASAAATREQVTELHVLSGYSGSEVIDNSGVRWTPDRYFSGGGLWSRDSGFVRGTSRPFLFTNWRTGEFGYDIPVAPGSYELRLFAVSPHRVGDEKLSGFNVALNGKPLLEAYDVIMSANGADVADEQVFRDVSPGEDGLVRVWFSNQVGSPMVNGLELTPGIPGKLKPIRLITQPTSFVDHKGQRWQADDYYTNGFRSSDRRKVSGTEDPELFGAERFGHFSYAIPVDRRGTYTVVLHFAEFYHGPQLPGGGGVGSRVFHVFCNGQALLRDFDVYKEAGSLRVIAKSFANIKPSAMGKINLTFEPVFNNATVSGIEVLDETR